MSVKEINGGEMRYLLVEGERDKEIVNIILKLLKINSKTIKIEACGGKEKLKKKAKELSASQKNSVMCLMDSDKNSIENMKAHKAKELNLEGVTVFCAVPSIEAWVFADDILLEKVLLENKKREKSINLLRRMSLPEEIIYPKQVLSNLFNGKIKDYTFMSKMNLERAITRSYSLKDFVIGISKELKMEAKEYKGVYGKNISRDIIINLLSETIDGDKVVYRTLKGREVTSKVLQEEIRNGSELGIEYISEVLRFSRDYFIKIANEGKE